MKTKHKVLGFIGVCFFVLLLLVGCTTDPNLNAIQGMWSYYDLHLARVVGEQHLIINWIFERGSFANRACCFVETNLSGKYRLLESEGNSLTLELYDMEGTEGTIPVSSGAVTTIEVIIHEDDTLSIAGTDGYIRISDPIR